MLLVILPLPFVHGAVCVDEYAQAIGFSVHPLSLVNISVGMSHSPFSIKLLVLGHSLIGGAICKLNDSDSFPHGVIVNFDIRFPVGLILIFCHHRRDPRYPPLTLVHLLGQTLACVSCSIEGQHVVDWLEVVDPY